MDPVTAISLRAWITGNFLKAGVILSCGLGITLQLRAGSGGLMAAQSLFKYFTTQSNAWIALACLAVLLVDWLSMARKPKSKRSMAEQQTTKWYATLMTVKYMFTVSILLTFMVFAVLLAPLMPRSYLMSPANFFLHYLTAMLATADYLICDYHHQMPRRNVLLGLVMPFLYLITALAASFRGVRFGGQRVPYFFMDYAKLGWFEINSQGMGVVYWVALLMVLLLIIGAGLRRLAEIRRKRQAVRSNDHPVVE
jgi:CDP-diglyceride synthetase